MDLVGALATIGAAFIGGGLGALFAARVTATGTKDAATIAAESAVTVASSARDAESRAWVNERSRELVDSMIVEVDRHYRQVGAQARGRQDAANGKADESTIPPLTEGTDPIRETVWRLSMVADEPVVAAAFRLYRASVAADFYSYNATEHFDGERVVGLTPNELYDLFSVRLIRVLDERDAFRNAFRAQLGQPQLVEPPPFGDEGIE